MKSLVELYNLALARLGTSQFTRVNDPEEDSAIASWCRSFYPNCLDNALYYADWSFATKFASLARAAQSGGIERPGYCYRMPTDLIRPLKVIKILSQYHPWRRGHNDTGLPYSLEGNFLWSAAPAPLYVAYIARIEDPNLWTPAFADALAWGLASELATPVLNDLQSKANALTMQRQVIHEAMAREQGAQNIHETTTTWTTESW